MLRDSKKRVRTRLDQKKIVGAWFCGGAGGPAAKAIGRVSKSMNKPRAPFAESERQRIYTELLDLRRRHALVVRPLGVRHERVERGRARLQPEPHLPGTP